MANKYTAHDYQKRVIDEVIKTPKVGLFLGMGTGKTIISLTAFTELYNDLEVDRVLIISPKKVAESVWGAECEKWVHTEKLVVSKILGTAKQRESAIAEKAQIYAINRENTSWLVDYLHSKKLTNFFDMLIVDESSSFKSPSSKRFKALKKMAFKRTILLTGTPISNGHLDLWSQIYLLDKGQRLGNTITKYKATFFTPGFSNGNVVYKYILRPGADKHINSLISDICLSMKAEDYLQLPERIDEVIKVELEPSMLKKYKAFEKESIMQVAEEDISAMNAASLANKLLQFANGAIYDEDRKVHHLHDSKLEMLDALIEKSGNENMLVAYNYKHDRVRIMERYPYAVELKTDDDLRAWNNGQIKMLLAHPASAGYGLNLQFGGSLVAWFGLNWSLELYQQFNARIFRQGQANTVRIYHLISSGTFDERVMEVLKGKANVQDKMLKAIKELRGRM